MYNLNRAGIKFLLSAALIVCYQCLNAQILNVDSELQDSLTKKRYLLVSGSFSHDKQKRSINDAECYIELLQKTKNRYAGVFVGQLNTVLSGKEIVQNEGYFQLRYRDLDTRKTSMEAYIQYQWNGLWGMQERKLAGMNVRQKVLDKKSGDFYVGLGGFYEMETWNYKGVEDTSRYSGLAPVQQNRMRVNSYVKVAKKLFRNCDVIAESFIQANAFSLANNPSVRWFLLGRINYNLTEKVQLSFNYDHIYNQSPPVPVKKLYAGYAFRFNVKL